MHCPTCGASNYLDARFCRDCGQDLHGSEQMPRIRNYLALSVLVTFFCCLPLGIAAIIYAAQVNGKLAAGDITGARQASRTALKLVVFSFLLGSIMIGLPLAYMLVWIFTY